MMRDDREIKSGARERLAGLIEEMKTREEEALAKCESRDLNDPHFRMADGFGKARSLIETFAE